MPMPVPTARIRAIMGYATLMVDMPISPTLFPTKNPSTMAYTPERANARMEGITKLKNNL